MSEYDLAPSFQPPMAIITFSSGLDFFKATASEYPPKREKFALNALCSFLQTNWIDFLARP